MGNTIQPRYVPPQDWFAWGRAAISELRVNPLLWIFSLAIAGVYSVSIEGLQDVSGIFSVALPLCLWCLPVLTVEARIQHQPMLGILVGVGRPIGRMLLAVCAWFLCLWIGIYLLSLVIHLFVVALSAFGLDVLPNPEGNSIMDNPDSPGATYSLSSMMIIGQAGLVLTHGVLLFLCPVIFFSIPLFICGRMTLWITVNLLVRAANLNITLIFATVMLGGVIMMLPIILLVMSDYISKWIVWLTLPVMAWYPAVMVYAYRDIFLHQSPVKKEFSRFLVVMKKQVVSQ